MRSRRVITWDGYRWGSTHEVAQLEGVRLGDEWGCGLVSLDLDGKELLCAQADAPGLTCETEWGVPSLRRITVRRRDCVGPDSPGQEVGSFLSLKTAS